MAKLVLPLVNETERLTMNGQGDNPAIPVQGDFFFNETDRQLYIGDGNVAGGIVYSGSGAGVTVEEEGTALTTAATTLNFVGDGVTATGNGAEKTITIPGGGGGGSGNPYNFGTITTPSTAFCISFGSITAPAGAFDAGAIE